MASYLDYCTSISENNPAARVKHFNLVNHIPQNPLTKRVAVFSCALSENVNQVFDKLDAEKNYVNILPGGDENHLMFEHCIRNGYAFIFRAQSIMDYTVKLFDTLKEKKYTIQIVYIPTSDPKHNKEMIDKCLPFADEVSFYSDSKDIPPRLGFKWKRENLKNGSGEMHHFNTYTQVKETFDASFKVKEGESAWKETFERYPFSIEFHDGAGRP